MFLQSLYYCFILLQETKNSSLFDKNCSQEKPQENAICDIQHEESWRGWTGKLQVTLLSAYIYRKKFCSQTFMIYSEKVL